MTPTQLNFFRNPDDNEALTDFLIEETMRYVNLQEEDEWFKTEVIQGREDLDPTKAYNMTDSEEKEYFERWNDASERYPSRQKSTYLTDGHMADLAWYLMDVTKDLTGVYVEDSGGIRRFCPIEVGYVMDSGEETHKIEEIPDKQVQPTPTPTPTIRPTIRPTERPSTLHTISSTARPVPTTTPPPSTSITPLPQYRTQMVTDGMMSRRDELGRIHTRLILMGMVFGTHKILIHRIRTYHRKLHQYLHLRQDSKLYS